MPENFSSSFVSKAGRKRKEIYGWRNRGKRACGIQMEEERSKNVRGEKKRRQKEGRGKRGEDGKYSRYGGSYVYSFPSSL